MPLFIIGLLAKAQAAFFAALSWLANPKNWPLVLIGVLLLALWIQRGTVARKDKVITSLHGSLTVAHDAFNRERHSYGVLSRAIDVQSAAIAALGRAGKAKTDKSAGIARDAARALADAHARAAPVLAVQTASSACLRADATDAAFLEAIR